MRRYVLPVLLVAIAVIASVLAARADDQADPGRAAVDTTAPALTTPVLSVRRVPEWLRQPTTDRLLATAVRGVIDQVPSPNAACLSVTRDGETIAEVSSLDGLRPGVLERLVTIAAFDAVGGAGFTTEVVRLADAPVVDGVLQGDLWLIGAGDPVLSTDAFISRFDDDRAFTSFATLAADTITALQQAGITRIEGDIVGDESKYDTGRTPGDVWPPEVTADNLVGPLSALLLDNGFTSFPPDSVDPAANTRARRPAAHAAGTLADIIEAFSDIEITGSAVTADQQAPADRIVLASIDSPGADRIARRAVVDATTAEMLFKETGVRTGVGSAAAGIGVFTALADGGIGGDDLRLLAFDGSGYADDNVVRCRLLTEILDSTDHPLAAGALRSVASTDAAACLPADLGTTSALVGVDADTTAVAGRTAAPNGDTISFAAIVNWVDANESRSACDDVVPALLAAVASHPAGPPVADLVPLPPSS